MQTLVGRLRSALSVDNRVDMRLVLGPNNVLYEVTAVDAKHFLGQHSRDVTGDDYYHERFDWATNARQRQPIEPRA